MTFKKMCSKENFEGVIRVVDIHVHDSLTISMRFNKMYIKFNVNISNSVQHVQKMNTTYMKFNIIYDLKDLVSEESLAHLHVLWVCTLRACDTDIFLSNGCAR